MIAHNASFAPSKLNIVLLIIPQGLQLRIWFKKHVKARKLPEKMTLAPQFSVQSELRSTNTHSFSAVQCVLQQPGLVTAGVLFFLMKMRPPTLGHWLISGWKGIANISHHLCHTTLMERNIKIATLKLSTHKQLSRCYSHPQLCQLYIYKIFLQCQF